MSSFRDGLTFNNKKFRNSIKLPEKIEIFSNDFYNQYYNGNRSDISETEFVIQRMKNNPKLLVELIIFKGLRCFYGTDSQNPKIEVLNAVIISIFVLFNLFLFFKLKHMNIEITFLFHILMLYFILTMGMSIIALSILRYQIPVFILILVLDLIFILNYRSLFLKK